MVSFTTGVHTVALMATDRGSAVGQRLQFTVPPLLSTQGLKFSKQNLCVCLCKCACVCLCVNVRMCVCFCVNVRVCGV